MTRAQEDARPYLCPECGQRHADYDSECGDECGAELLYRPERCGVYHPDGVVRCKLDLGHAGKHRGEGLASVKEWPNAALSDSLPDPEEEDTGP